MVAIDMASQGTPFPLYTMYIRALLSPTLAIPARFQESPEVVDETFSGPPDDPGAPEWFAWDDWPRVGMSINRGRVAQEFFKLATYMPNLLMVSCQLSSEN